MAAAVGRGAHSHAPGDPLAWIWAQAETVALCLLLTYGLQAGDDAALQHGLRAMQLPQPPHTAGGPRLIVPAVWDQPRVHICWPSPLHSSEDWRTYARHIRREVLNTHLRGIRPQFVERGSTDHPGCQFRPSLPWSTGISSRSPRAGSSNGVPRPRVGRSLSRHGARSGFVRGEAGARQSVCGPRPEPEAGRAATRVMLVPRAFAAPVYPLINDDAPAQR